MGPLAPVLAEPPGLLRKTLRWAVRRDPGGTEDGGGGRSFLREMPSAVCVKDQDGWGIQSSSLGGSLKSGPVMALAPE